LNTQDLRKINEYAQSMYPPKGVLYSVDEQEAICSSGETITTEEKD
jgi:hypothetical protein